MLLALYAHTAFAQEGLPYVALKHTLTNARTGPGHMYPIQYQYHKKNLPFKVMEHYEHWRKVVDYEGQISWIHKNLLTVKKTMIIVSKKAPAYKNTNIQLEPVAYVLYGEIGIIQKCQLTLCLCQFSVTTPQAEGSKTFLYDLWIDKSHMFGAF